MTEQHFPRVLRYRGAVGFELEDFVRSLASDASATRRAYRGDVEAFVTWAGRAGISDPGEVDRLMLRRYLAYLATRRYSRRTIARKAAAVRRYFAWLRRHELISVDPSRRLSAPQGEARLPRVLTASELKTLLEPVPDPSTGQAAGSRSTRATTPCSSFSTAVVYESRSSAGSPWATSI